MVHEGVQEAVEVCLAAWRGRGRLDCSAQTCWSQSRQALQCSSTHVADWVMAGDQGRKQHRRCRCRRAAVWLGQGHSRLQIRQAPCHGGATEHNVDAATPPIAPPTTCLLHGTVSEHLRNCACVCRCPLGLQQLRGCLDDSRDEELLQGYSGIIFVDMPARWGAFTPLSATVPTCRSCMTSLQHC